MTGIKIPFEFGTEGSGFGFVTVEVTSKVEREDGTIYPEYRDQALKSAIQALETHREANARWTTEDFRHDRLDSDEQDTPD